MTETSFNEEEEEEEERIFQRQCNMRMFLLELKQEEIPDN